MDPSETTHTLTVAETLKNNPIGNFYLNCCLSATY